MSVVRWGARLGAVTLLSVLPVLMPHAAAVAVADGDGSRVAAAADSPDSGVRSTPVSRVAVPAGRAARAIASRPGDARAPMLRSARPTAAAAIRSAGPAAARVGVPAAPSVPTPPPGSAPEPPAPQAFAAPAAASPSPAAARAVVAASSATTSFPVITGVVTGVDRFLTNTANWLYSLPANPLTDIVSGAVYLIRRSLFPSSVGVITAPIQVPLYFATIDDSGTQKVGIYVSLGGGTPQLFEFDTGGKGFYATYASGNPEFSPWWGDAVKTSTTAIQNKYDSGLQYKGFAATTTVSLYASPGAAMPLLTTGVATVAQVDSITDGSETLWSSTGSTNPPVDTAFWGDFGMAPNYPNNAVSNLIAQLTFACGVLPGYRIHIDPASQTAWMQVGLTSADVQDPAGLYFPMNLDPKAPQGAVFPNSGLRYYGEQLFNAAVSIGDDVIDSPLGITPDTGASTKLHNIPSSEMSAYDRVVRWDDPQTKDSGRLYNDLSFFLTGTNTFGQSAKFFDFTTNDRVNDGQVKVQNQGSISTGYYLNTGISLFYAYDVVYYLGTPQGGGQLGLI